MFVALLGFGLRAMRQRRRKLRGGENVEKGNSTEYTQATICQGFSVFECGIKEALGWNGVKLRVERQEERKLRAEAAKMQNITKYTQATIFQGFSY